MKATQLARTECANYEPNGTCTWLSIEPLGNSLVMPCAGKKCLIGNGEKCGYFQECVLGLARVVKDPKLLREISEAALEHERMVAG